MKMLDPIYPEVIEKIKAEYKIKIDTAPEEMKAVFQTQCDMEVAAEIGKQRQEAILQGGELGERIKAENEAMMKELEKSYGEIDPEILAAAKKKQEELEANLRRPKFCPNCGTPVGSEGNFCSNCGAKLV